MSNARETKISSSSLVVEVATQDDLLPVRANSGVELATAADTASRGRQRHSRGDVHVALGAPDFVRGGRRLSEVILSVGNLERVRRFHARVVAILWAGNEDISFNFIPLRRINVLLPSNVTLSEFSTLLIIS